LSRLSVCPPALAQRRVAACAGQAICACVVRVQRSAVIILLGALVCAGVRAGSEVQATRQRAANKGEAVDRYAIKAAISFLAASTLASRYLAKSGCL
jgi:hypothetical protein